MDASCLRRPEGRIGLVWLFWFLSVAVAMASGPRTGPEIYRQQCAACHGAHGEGTAANYPNPLMGDRSLNELADYIARSMPEDKPGTCTGDDARRVAEYVYETFYSRTARARNQPLRIELARLTVRQYQNVITDLVGSFRWQPARDDRQGLQTQYFRGPDFGGRPALERIERTIDFDLGERSPVPDKLDAHEFSIRWKGALYAPETGNYDIGFIAQNGARLWLNDAERPLIDASVRSGAASEYREALRLLGGRWYPLRVDLFKRKDKAAGMKLQWKPPRRALEVIPELYLSPATNGPELIVLQTPFPPDDRSMGYERGTSISKAWEQATAEAALETTAYVLDHAKEFVRPGGDGSQRLRRFQEFAHTFAERAFRRPLTEGQRQLYVERQFAASPDAESGLKRSLLLTLQSPRFLYRELGGLSDPQEIPARLALTLWDSLPDRPLLDASANGQLKTPEALTRQAERMLDDPRTRAKLREFFRQWLAVETPPDLAKDPAHYAGFDAALASDLRTSLDLFVDDVLWSPASDFRQLLVGDAMFLNGRLAKFYGADLPADAPFTKVTFQPGERAGLLSHPYLMSTFAYTSTTSPIHRGVFVARGVLGRTLRPPPIAVAPLAPELHANLTTRQRVALQTQPEACQTCHAMINPLGYSLEQFDAAGRLRREENGRPIDASGSYRTQQGDEVRFAGARQLGQFLARSDEVHEAFVEQLFHYLVKQPVRAYGPQLLPDLKRAFVTQQFHIRKLVVAIATAAAADRKPATLAQGARP